MKKTKTADDWYAAVERWGDETAALRTILTRLPVTETLKWGMPYYTHDAHNVVGVVAFKSYFGLWFTDGALLADEGKKLINAQEGKTKALRQWRMQSAKDIEPALVRQYVEEAIAVAGSGETVSRKKPGSLEVPTELAAEFGRNPKLEERFAELRPGQQREYVAYVADAKREQTRISRVEKIAPMIRRGAGLNDRYRK